MIVLDVNVCVLAFRPDLPGHAAMTAWLEEALAGPEPVGAPDFVLASFLRLVTNHRIFHDPAPPAAAVGFCDALLATPSAQLVHGSQRHWSIFGQLVASMRLRVNDVPDALLAAVAIERGARLATLDTGFRRFAGLRVLRPVED